MSKASTQPRGLFRVRNGSTLVPDDVRVEDAGTRRTVTEPEYVTRGYQPPIDQLPEQDQWDVAWRAKLAQNRKDAQNAPPAEPEELAHPGYVTDEA